MVRDHIAERSGQLVELAPFLDPDSLRRGDLHMIDAVAVPNWLENPVSETKCRDALDRVLSEKMIDPEDLVLAQDTQDAGIQRARGVEAMAERLLDHHAPPKTMVAFLIFGLICQLCLSELLDDAAEELIANGEVEDDVALRPMGLLDFRKNTAEPFVKLWICQVALDIQHSFRQVLPRGLINAVDSELGRSIPYEAFQHAVELVAPGLRSPRCPGDTNQREFLG